MVSIPACNNSSSAETVLQFIVCIVCYSVLVLLLLFVLLGIIAFIYFVLSTAYNISFHLYCSSSSSIVEIL